MRRTDRRSRKPWPWREILLQVVGPFVVQPIVRWVLEHLDRLPLP